MTKTLHLTLYKKWFDLVAQGKKNFEYRKITPYWISRLRGKHFDEVLFRNGYGNHRPTTKRKCVGIAEDHDNNRFVIILNPAIPTP